MTDRNPDTEVVPEMEANAVDRYDDKEAATDFGDWWETLTPDEKVVEMYRLAQERTEADET
jgi:hypothetical protein